VVLCVNLMDLNCSISNVIPEKVPLADQKILGVIGDLLFSNGQVLFSNGQGLFSNGQG
jgi:hypothetical protein